MRVTVGDQSAENYHYCGTRLGVLSEATVAAAGTLYILPAASKRNSPSNTVLAGAAGHSGYINRVGRSLTPNRYWTVSRQGHTLKTSLIILRP